MPPSNPALSADLAATKETDTDIIHIGEAVTYTIKIINNGPEIATAAVLIDSLPSHVSISNLQTDRGGCILEATGLKCEFGDMVIGDIVTVSYSGTPSLPGTLVNGVFVYSELDDSDWTNNTAIVTIDIPVPIDIKPRDNRNKLNPDSNGVIPVAILSQADFDVRIIDRSTLRFGPGKSMPVHLDNGHLEDVNHDGIRDLNPILFI